MRDIRFRAWDKWQKVIGIIEPDSIDFKNSSLRIGRQDIYLEDVELMQYTGLKDKNGVEIYEGDIVSSWKWGKSATISWVNDKAAFLASSDEYEPMAFDNAEREVIGNIWENGDLLK